MYLLGRARAAREACATLATQVTPGGGEPAHILHFLDRGGRIASIAATNILILGAPPSRLQHPGRDMRRTTGTAAGLRINDGKPLFSGGNDSVILKWRHRTLSPGCDDPICVLCGVCTGGELHVPGLPSGSVALNESERAQWLHDHAGAWKVAIIERDEASHEVVRTITGQLRSLMDVAPMTEGVIGALVADHSSPSQGSMSVQRHQTHAYSQSLCSVSRYDQGELGPAPHIGWSTDPGLRWRVLRGARHWCGNGARSHGGRPLPAQPRIGCCRRCCPRSHRCCPRS